MAAFSDINSKFYKENIRNSFYKLTTYEQKNIVDRLIRQYLKGKICYEMNSYVYNNNTTTTDLVLNAANLYGSEAIYDIVHFILKIVSNIQGYDVEWRFEELNEKKVILDIKNDKWNLLTTDYSIDSVDLFNYIYDKFQNEFLKEMSSKNIFTNFFKYVSIPTNSNSSSKEVPSTKKQFNLAKVLVEQLKSLGVDEYIFDSENCYVYAKLNGNKDVPSIGFISHMDTSEDAKDCPINTIITNNYDGEDVVYNGNTILKVSENPDLLNHVGKSLVTTDGNTLLGADDKAGIAEIMSMVEYFVNNDVPHGDIYIAFTPDEEIGKSLNFLDRNIFNPKYAYTVDGEHLGEISYENFNAADVKIEINGKATHTGYAKNKMVNATLIANTINTLLPNEIPANTEGYEGFYHLHKIKGDISHAEMLYLIRDFGKQNYYKRLEILQAIVDKLNEKYNNCIKITIHERYKNMYNVLKDNMEVVDFAFKAIEKVGIEPYVKPIRGGTDGTRLSFEGIPCPNLGTGGHNFHSNEEYIALEDMAKIRDILISIVQEYYLAYTTEKGVSKIKK